MKSHFEKYSKSFEHLRHVIQKLYKLEINFIYKLFHQVFPHLIEMVDKLFHQVFPHLIEKVNCRLLSATHYHPLTKEFASHPHVMLQHMACTFKGQELVFLDRLRPGACPERYGLQVATVAGISGRAVEAASRKPSERTSDWANDDWSYDSSWSVVENSNHSLRVSR